MSTGLCTDERFRAHLAPGQHPERPERLVAIDRALVEAKLTDACTRVPARPALRRELELVHDAIHLDELEALLASAAHDGWIDPDTYYSAATWEASLLAAGSAVEIATLVAHGELDNAAAFVRPPGHHATRSRAMGFCLLNNIAVAAAVLRDEGARVAIFDWDVHHGNGTEEIFDEDERVLYLSTHEWPQYPGTGPAHYTGRGAGLGFTVNVPLPHGTDGPAYLAAYRGRIRPPLYEFKPDVILVSAGFDAHKDDPLGGLALDEETYVEVLRDLLALQPKCALVLEGGYDLNAIARSSVGVVQTLLGNNLK